MHLTPRRDSNVSASSSSRTRRRRSTARRPIDALITLRKPSFSRAELSAAAADAAAGGASDDDDPDAGPPRDRVAMSSAAQKVIPATLKLVSLESKHAVTSHTHTPAQHSAFAQAGGHDGAFDLDGPVLIKKVTRREAHFYQLAEDGHWPTKFLPSFYGRTHDGHAVRIQNLTHGFRRPCVMDLKMGQQTVEDSETSLMKKIKMNALDRVTKSKYAGVRLEGLSMYRTVQNTDNRIKGTKAQSHSLSVRVSLQDVITFFLTDNSGVRTDLALRFQAAIEAFLHHFEQNSTFRFIGSSILFIYDNDDDTPRMRWAHALRNIHKLNPKARLSEDQISGLTRRTKCDIRMIDFAHTSPMPPHMHRDDGYITGLRTILKALEAIREFRAKPIFSVANAVIDLMEDCRAKSKASLDKPADTDDASFTFNTLLGELTPLLENGSTTSDSDEAAS